MNIFLYFLPSELPFKTPTYPHLLTIMAPTKREQSKHDLDRVISSHNEHHKALTQAITGDKQTVRARASVLRQDLVVLSNKWEAVVARFYAFKVARDENDPGDATELEAYKTKHVRLRTDLTTVKHKTNLILDLSQSYSPTSPSYSSTSASYLPGDFPIFQSLLYSPKKSPYSPSSLVYSRKYSPTSPSYFPTSLSYSPDNTSPSYSPSVPKHSPTLPSYSPPVIMQPAQLTLQQALATQPALPNSLLLPQNSSTSTFSTPEFVPTATLSTPELVSTATQPSLPKFVPKSTQPSLPEFVPKATQPSLPEFVPKATQPSLPEIVPKATQLSLPEFVPKATRPSLPELVPKATRFIPELVPKATQSNLHLLDIPSKFKVVKDGVTKMLVATTHIGSENSKTSQTTMEQYIAKRRADGVNIINLRKTWEKLVVMARAIAAIENPAAEVFVTTSPSYAQRAVLKFALYLGAILIVGQFIPGASTNQILDLLSIPEEPPERGKNQFKEWG